MAGLSWHSGAAHHRRALDQFVCTDPPKRRYEPHYGRIHPRPYELEVQSHLRGLRLPPTRGEALLVGVDDRGVSAAAHFGFDDTGSQFIIWALGVAVHCRGQGHGGTALGHVLGTLAIVKRKKRLDCGVLTHIDPRNDASRALFRSAGFEFLGLYDGYEGWVRDI